MHLEPSSEVVILHKELGIYGRGSAQCVSDPQDSSIHSACNSYFDRYIASIETRLFAPIFFTFY